MPATLSQTPLGISCGFSDGSRAFFSLDAGDGPSLARDLLTGLVELVHPHGSVDAAGTAAQYVAAARNMVSTLGGASGLTRAKVAQYWMSTTGWREACTRRMLVGFDVATGGLTDAVRELAEGRAFNPQPYRRALPPYPEAEWARLTQACSATMEDSFSAQRAALVRAARGRDPATGGWSEDNLAWLLSHIGPSTLARVGAHMGTSAQTVRERGGFPEASTGLFPHLEVTAAYVLAFGIHSGIVPDGIADLVVDAIDWAGDASVLLHYVKGRTGPESVTLPRRAIRVLEQWLEHSALLRSFVPIGERHQLWLGLSQVGQSIISTGPVHRNVIHGWAARHELTDDAGRPLKIHRHRIRTTHQSLRDRRAWIGTTRATIDPNHSPAVEGDHYLSATTPAQRHAVETIVEDAQHDLVRRSEPPTVVSEDDRAALADAWPELVAGLGLDEEVIAELLGGERDVFVAGCGVRPPACDEPAADEGVLLPAVASHARCPVHGRLRPLRPAHRRGTCSLPAGRAG
ncbi:MAG: hypothetical protein ACYCV5_03945 [Acidimicrobiales bacterium]